MVRAGGLGYAIDISKPMGSRITELTHLKSGKPIEAGKSYTVAGWASVREGVEGPPIWDVLKAHVSKKHEVKIEPNTAVKVTGA
jgi:sulfur-oxidizing protein SoxB